MDIKQLLTLVETSNLRIETDSRKVGPGDVFVAIRGSAVDAHKFIPAALAAGAKYVVCEQQLKENAATVVQVQDSANAWALLAQASFANPAKKLLNLAVTGTNGKTTVAWLARAIVNFASPPCGMMGTVEYDTGKQIIPSSLTTPDPTTIAKAQSEMLQAAAKYMITEASSHALSQQRLAGIDFKAAAFTNLTGDHLDYHKTTENYLAAKSMLFEKLSPTSTAVLNKQDPYSFRIAALTKAKLMWYAVDADADLNAQVEKMDVNGTTLKLVYNATEPRVQQSCTPYDLTSPFCKKTQKGATHESECGQDALATEIAILTTPLIGSHNISNILAAAGLCLAAGFDLQTVVRGIETLKVVPGRLEKVQSEAPFTVLVDYAHTDDALKNVLATLKPLCRGKLIVVFGCGGDRDRTKRPRMAAVAEQFADIIIVTSDNPRTEEPEAIIGEVFTGFERPTAPSIFHEANRETAIALAIEFAAAEDIILIAGKGHEDYQIIGTTKTHFSDIEIARKYLK